MTVWAPHVTVATVVEKDARYLLVEEPDGTAHPMPPELVRQILSAQRSDHRSLGQFAILYRTNAQSRLFEEELLKYLAFLRSRTSS